MVKLSIGMPAYNRASLLKSTIQQILDQTFWDYELIIYNDGSTDNTAEVIKSIDDSRIIFLNHDNMGPPHPLNGILKHAKGEYIIILHDHDFFEPTLLEKSIKALEKYPNAGFVLQGSAWIDEDGISSYSEYLLNLPEYNHGYEHAVEMLANNRNFSSIFHACCMVRRSAHEKAGWYYDERFGLYADVDLWYRLLKITDFIYINEVLFKFRTREVNGHFLSNREFEVCQWKYEIAKENASRIICDKTYLKKVEKNLQKNWLNCVEISTIKYATRKRYDLFVKGLSLLLQNSIPFHKMLLIRSVLANHSSILIAMYFLIGINNLRKKLLKNFAINI